MPLDQPYNDYVVSGPSYSIQDLRPKNLVIACGKGHVSISLEDGKVTLTECTIDDGAKAFWKAVETFAPIRKSE